MNLSHQITSSLLSRIHGYTPRRDYRCRSSTLFSRRSFRLQPHSWIFIPFQFPPWTMRSSNPCIHHHFGHSTRFRHKCSRHCISLMTTSSLGPPPEVGKPFVPSLLFSTCGPRQLRHVLCASSLT